MDNNILIVLIVGICLIICMYVYRNVIFETVTNIMNDGCMNYLGGFTRHMKNNNEKKSWRKKKNKKSSSRKVINIKTSDVESDNEAEVKSVSNAESSLSEGSLSIDKSTIMSNEKSISLGSNTYMSGYTDMSKTSKLSEGSGNIDDTDEL